jgi:hypothetical protein
MIFPDTALCGLWIATGAADYLVYEQATSLVHQEHIVLHELGHLLCDHNAAGNLEPELFRQLGPAAVRSALGRTNYSTLEEREAEFVASFLVGYCRPGGRSGAPTAEGDLDHRLQRAFGHGPMAGG